MGYKYDVFLSYKRDSLIGNWIYEDFKPLFDWLLEGSLGRAPRVFIDTETDPGVSWRLDLNTALAHSQCLVAIWSPSYFESSWCMYECCVMLHREQQQGYRTPNNPSGLVLPVVVSDGKYFPDFAKNIQQFDCRNFAIPAPVLKNTKIYIDFHNEMKEWVRGVARAIERAPEWNEEWLNDPDIDIPETPIPTLRLPTLE